MMNEQRILVVAIESETHHAAELLRQCITNDRDNTNSAQCDEREGDAVVTLNHVEVSRFILDDVVYLCKVA